MPERTRARAVLVGVTVALCCACSTPRVRSEHAADADFSKLQRYGWLEGRQQGTGALRMGPEAFDEMVRDVVDRQLAARGFEKVDDGADFLVRYHAAVDAELRMQSVRRDRGGSNIAVPTQYKKGTLLLDVVEPGSEAVIWRGSASAEIDRMPREQRRERLYDVVGRMLDQLPKR